MADPCAIRTVPACNRALSAIRNSVAAIGLWQDLSDEHAWQLSQEFRLASNFSGPFNFSVGGNYLHYETEEDYYVFINSLTAFLRLPGIDCNRVPDIHALGVRRIRQFELLARRFSNFPIPSAPHGPWCLRIYRSQSDQQAQRQWPQLFPQRQSLHLNSYAAFGEAYYNVLSDLKLTAGLRWTEDRKHFTDIPSEVLVDGWGYPVTGVVDQQWDELTGRAVAQLDAEARFHRSNVDLWFLLRMVTKRAAQIRRAQLLTYGGNARRRKSAPIHPLTFKPEFIDAFEMGSKNTLLDGALTINGDVFYYNYENYQISEIVDRTSINLNFDAHVKGAEIESSWEPIAGLAFQFCRRLGRHRHLQKAIRRSI